MPTSEIIITNIGRLELTKQAISNAGLDKFHVVADFDRTITKNFVNGARTSSIISVLCTEKMLTPDYPAKARELFDKYYAIETDINYPDDKKLIAMHEWWTKHFQLLIDSKLNKKDLERVASTDKIQLRAGICDMIKWLHEKTVPLLIFSASGLGVDIITLYLKKCRHLYDNIHIVSNIIKWDDNGYAVGVREPIIHNMNKGEHALKNYPIFKLIKNRKNILLLGDDANDVDMVEGIECENIIKVGFLNTDVEKNLETFKKHFDVIITNDGEMNFVNQLLEEMF